MLLFVFHLSKFPHILYCFSVKIARHRRCTFNVILRHFCVIIFVVEKQQVLDILKVCRSQWPLGLSCGSAVFACWERGFESCRGHRCLSFVTVVLCEVEVSVTDWSLVQRSPTECGVSEFHLEAWIMGGPGPLGLFCHGKKIWAFVCSFICPTFKARAPYYIVICGLSGCNFSTLTYKLHDLQR